VIKAYYKEEKTPMLIFLTNTEQMEKIYIACIVLGITALVYVLNNICLGKNATRPEKTEPSLQIGFIL